VRRELKAYGGELATKKEIVALSKCDALDADTIAERQEALKRAARKKPLLLSAVSGMGVQDVLFALARVIETSRKEEQRETEGTEARVWQP
jgi:GTP-binding protein